VTFGWTKVEEELVKQLMEDAKLLRDLETAIRLEIELFGDITYLEVTHDDP
jgi:hypothetical protein